MSNSFEIGLGYEGATDSALTLSHKNEIKEYGVESVAWNILAVIHPSEAIIESNPLWNVLRVVWNHCEDDRFYD